MKTYTISEVAAKLHISRQGVHKLIKEFNLEPIKVDAPMSGLKYFYQLTEKDLALLQSRADRRLENNLR